MPNIGGQAADYGKLGYLLSRHHEPAPDNSERDVVFRARVEKHADFDGDTVDPPRFVDVGDEVDQLYSPGRQGLTVGPEFASGVRERRPGIGAWGGAIPFVWTQQGGFPLWSRTFADPTLAMWTDGTAVGAGMAPDAAGIFQTLDGQKVRIGEAGVLIAGTDPTNQSTVLFPLREHVASHRGDPTYSTPVYDMSGDAIDHNRAGGLHSHLRVTHDGGEHVPAFLLTGAPDGTGYGVCYGQGDGASPTVDPPQGQSTVAGPKPQQDDNPAAIVCFLSHEKDGPIHPGHAEDKHGQGKNAEGNPINPAHIRIGALFYRDQVEDGPLKLSKWYRGAVYPQATHVDFGWNKDDEVWDWVSYSPIFEPLVPIPQEKIPVIPEPRIPLDRPTDKAVEPTGEGPGEEDAANHDGEVMPADRVPRTYRPAHTPFQLSLPSIRLTGEAYEAQHPYDGRDGWPQLPLRFSPSGATEARPDSRLALGYDWREDGADLRADLRGGPTPYTAHIAGIPKVLDADGEYHWDYQDTLEPGETTAFGVARASTLLFAPAPYDAGQHSMGVADFTVCGQLTVGLRSRVDNLGPRESTRLAWGMEDWESGGMVGGAFFEPDDSTLDLVVGFLDAAGADRSAGALRPDVAEQQLGTSAKRWSLFAVDGDFSGDVNISGKLTVAGLIDPTGLVLDPQAAAPANNCIWINESDGRLYYTNGEGTSTALA